MAAISTFSSAIDADLAGAADGGGKRSVAVIGIALDDTGAGESRLSFVVVDHDGRGRLVPAADLTFTDDSVMPPKYG